MPTPEEVKEYRAEGKHGFRNGESCPYPTGTTASNLWKSGYAVAKRWAETDKIKGEGRTCATCLHRWESKRGVERACGKEIVQQVGIKEARSEEGDCGPTGRYYTPDPDKLAGDARPRK